MGLVLDLDQHRSKHDAVFGSQLSRPNVGAGPTDRLADIGVKSAPVLATHGEPHDKRLPFNLPPVDFDASVLFTRERKQVGAVAAVDGDAPPLSHVTHHGIAWNGLAALCVPHHQPFDAVNLDATPEPEPLDHS